MYVIFPAEELILMTYGAAIPRINPRPTLDCLREPKVPIYIPARSKPTSIQSENVKSSNVLCNCNIITPVFNQLPDAFVSQDTVVHQGTNSDSLPTIPSISKIPRKRSLVNSLSTCDNLRTKNTTPKLSVKFLNSSFTSTTTTSSRTKIATAAAATTITTTETTAAATAIIPTTAAATSATVAAATNATNANNTNNFLTEVSMYNDLNMQSQSASPSKVPRSNLERGKLIGGRGNTPLRTTTSTNQSDEYDKCERKHSPSICLDLLPPDDPTRQKFGPGWGRPMSPMDVTSEPSTSSATAKSGTKLRLKPKLHIPLGKLGRSASAEPKESHRLREDLQLHIENPIFKAENLRQRNFDVFFDAGEPVYKLQPKTPNNVPSSDSAYGGSNHGSTLLHKERNSGSSGLFARSSCEDKLLSNTNKANETPYGRGRAASVGAGAVIGTSTTGSSGGDGGGGGYTSVGGSSGGGGSGSGSGTPQKGDRFLGKFFKWSKKS